MKIETHQFVALAGIALLLFLHTGGKIPGLPLGPAAPTIETPTPELQQAVQPVKALVAGSAEAAGLRDLFAAVAEDIARSDSSLQSVGQVLAIVKAGRPLMYAPGQTTTIAGLPETVRAFLNAQLGDEAPLDAAKRAKAAAAFKALAWACS